MFSLRFLAPHGIETKNYCMYFVLKIGNHNRLQVFTDLQIFCFIFWINIRSKSIESVIKTSQKFTKSVEWFKTNSENFAKLALLK